MEKNRKDIYLLPGQLESYLEHRGCVYSKETVRETEWGQLKTTEYWNDEGLHLLVREEPVHRVTTRYTEWREE
jgi:hypothetical protein